MAIINCPECQHELSNTIKKCPQCGHKIVLHNYKNVKIIIILIGVIAALLFGSIIGAKLIKYININRELIQIADQSVNAIDKYINRENDYETASKLLDHLATRCINMNIENNERQYINKIDLYLNISDASINLIKYDYSPSNDDYVALLEIRNEIAAFAGLPKR